MRRDERAALFAVLVCVVVVALILIFTAGRARAAQDDTRHAHSSSLYDGPKVPLEDELHRLVTATDPSANLASLTEVGSDARTDILKNAAPGEWGAWVPNADKCCADVGLMWNKAEWELDWKQNVRLTNKTWTDGQGRKHVTYAASAIFKHRSGPRVFLSVAHLPSGVQNGDKFKNNAQSAAWKSAVNGWHTHWNEIRKAKSPAVGMLTADWNIDFHMKTWRDYVQDVFPSLNLTWKNNMPNGGTHGKRLIDATWATKPAKKVRLLKDDDSSDHRPYGERIKFPG